jgi:DNA-binding NtrC family response regulator
MAQKILVVEDDADQRAGLAEILRHEGYSVLEAASAEDAVATLDSREVDLVVSDYQLGGATGAWLARLTARVLRPSSPRAILVTGHDELADAEGLTVLKKPLDIDHFLNIVARALDERHPEAAPAPVPAQRIAFALYVNDSLPSRRVRKALKTILDRYDRNQIGLTEVHLAGGDVHTAEEHRIVATPTLVKTFPAPPVWITGEFEDSAILERLLEQAGVEARA